MRLVPPANLSPRRPQIIKVHSGPSSLCKVANTLSTPSRPRADRFLPPLQGCDGNHEKVLKHPIKFRALLPESGWAKTTANSEASVGQLQRTASHAWGYVTAVLIVWVAIFVGGLMLQVLAVFCWGCSPRIGILSAVLTFASRCGMNGEHNAPTPPQSRE